MNPVLFSIMRLLSEEREWSEIEVCVRQDVYTADFRSALTVNRFSAHASVCVIFSHRFSPVILIFDGQAVAIVFHGFLLSDFVRFHLDVVFLSCP